MKQSSKLRSLTGIGFAAPIKSKFLKADQGRILTIHGAPEPRACRQSGTDGGREEKWFSVKRFWRSKPSGLRDGSAKQ
jgi:hypothetical protein